MLDARASPEEYKQNRAFIRRDTEIYAAERRQAIIQRAREDGRVEVATLAAVLGVTAETVRRDLTALQEQGVLRRVHGGALPIERMTLEAPMAARDVSMGAEKDAIARAAAKELAGAETIVIESGSTTARLASMLPANRALTVITNSVAIALSLLAVPRLTVMTVGGRVRSRTYSEVDGWALRSISEIFADVAFLGTNGLSVERGLTTPDPSEGVVKAAMLRAARRRVLLADHTKVGNDCFYRYGSLSDVDLLITDSGLDDLRAARIEDAGPKVVRT